MRLFHRQRTPGAEAIDSRPRRGGQRRHDWGMPGRCPACDGPGYLDRIDMIDLVAYQHCPSCGEQWEEREADFR